MGVPAFCTAALCLVCLDPLISCALAGGGTLPKDTNLDSASKPSQTTSVDQLTADRLSSEIFPASITDYLSPEMFSQVDPLIYFLEKTVKSSFGKLNATARSLERFLYFRKFPSRYIPYAELLKNLVNCQLNLEPVKYPIDNMRLFKSDYLSLPARLLPPDLVEFFSSDIILDDKYPFQLIVKLANLSKGKIRDLCDEFEKAYYENRSIDHNLLAYLAQLWGFIMNDRHFPRLLASVSKMRNVISGELPNPGTNTESDLKKS